MNWLCSCLIPTTHFAIVITIYKSLYNMVYSLLNSCFVSTLCFLLYLNFIVLVSTLITPTLLLLVYDNVVSVSILLLIKYVPIDL